MINELLFVTQTITVSLFSLGAFKLGKEALVALVCLFCLLANLFVIKQIILFGLAATCSDAFSVGAVLSLNLLQEYFGKESAKKSIWISFFLLLLYVIMAQFHLHYVPSIYDATQIHFVPVLMFMPRIMAASFLTYIIVQHFNCHFYGFLKNKLSDSWFLSRNVISIMLCQLLDTILFSFLGLYGIIERIGDIIMVSYAIKVAAILISTPFLMLSRKIVRK